MINLYACKAYTETIDNNLNKTFDQNFKNFCLYLCPEDVVNINK